AVTVTASVASGDPPAAAATLTAYVPGVAPAVKVAATVWPETVPWAMLPPVALHTSVAGSALATVVVTAALAPVCRLSEAGERVAVTAGGGGAAVTAMAAAATAAPLSSVRVRLKSPAEPPAVKVAFSVFPLGGSSWMVPPVTCHCTAAIALAATPGPKVAVKVWVAPATTLALAGSTEACMAALWIAAACTPPPQDTAVAISRPAKSETSLQRERRKSRTRSGSCSDEVAQTVDRAYDPRSAHSLRRMPERAFNSY